MTLMGKFDCTSLFIVSSLQSVRWGTFCFPFAPFVSFSDLCLFAGPDSSPVFTLFLLNSKKMLGPDFSSVQASLARVKPR